MISRISARIVIAVLAIAISVTSIALAFAPSLSVGLVYFPNSEACASCHYEVPYYEGWKTTVHGIENVSCIDCHTSSTINDETCLQCHDDYDLTNKTRFLWSWQGAITPVDSHAKTSHVGVVSCIDCHLQHKFRLGVFQSVTDDFCHLCHETYIEP